MSLRINAPFKTKEEVVPLIEAGADELYCGYLPLYWKKKFTNLEFERKGGGSNFEDLRELKKAVEIAHKKGITVAVTLNGLYVENQYPFLLRAIKELCSLDIDAFIVADLGLLLTLRDLGCKKKIHISTGATVFNSQSCAFYKQFGVSRIILDRQTSLSAMKYICSTNPDIEFEVFILNTLCVYIDGFCTFMHAYTKEFDKQELVTKKQNEFGRQQINIFYSYDLLSRADACTLQYKIKVYNKNKRLLSGSKIQPTFFKHAVDGVECGACALYEISKSGVDIVKIVGRQLLPEKHIGDTKFIYSVIKILKDNPKIKKQDFVFKTQELYKKCFNYSKRCLGNNCYYPLSSGY